MGKMGLGSAIAARVVFSARFKVLVEYGGRDQRGGWAGSSLALISAMLVTHSSSKDGDRYMSNIDCS